MSGYILSVPADESPVDMRAVIDFYDHCYRDKPDGTTELKLHTFAKENLDINVVMRLSLNISKGQSNPIETGDCPTHFICRFFGFGRVLQVLNHDQKGVGIIMKKNFLKKLRIVRLLPVSLGLDMLAFHLQWRRQRQGLKR